MRPLQLLYRHPEGMGSLVYDSQEGHLIIRNEETNEIAHVVIGSDQLPVLAEALRAAAHPAPKAV